jgi:hypothetical protein
MIGWIKDMTGSFLGGLYFVAGLLVLSAVLTLSRVPSCHLRSGNFRTGTDLCRFST